MLTMGVTGTLKCETHTQWKRGGYTENPEGYTCYIGANKNRT
jgi:hypothetical protein